MLLQVPPNYDSLLGKLIVWAEDRPAAINRMRRALNELVISGVPTTIQYHTMILDIESFQKGIVDTGFIPKHAEELKEPPPSPKTVKPLFASKPTCVDWKSQSSQCCSPAAICMHDVVRPVFSCEGQGGWQKA